MDADKRKGIFVFACLLLFGIVAHATCYGEIQSLTVLAFEAAMAQLTSEKISYSKILTFANKLPLGLIDLFVQSFLSNDLFNEINKSKLLLEIAARIESHIMAYKLIKQVACRSYLGYQEFFSFDDSFTQISIEKMDSLHDPMSIALKEENMNKVAFLLLRGHKFFQEHLVLMLRLRNERLAKLLINSNVDLRVYIHDDGEKLDIREYARRQQCLKVMKLIESKLSDEEMHPENIFPIECYLL